jgi:hypothetical protein
MSGKYQTYPAYKASGVYLVPTRCVGTHTDRAAVYNAARCHCIPTRRVGTREL